MKATGIVRRIDDSGESSCPKRNPQGPADPWGRSSGNLYRNSRRSYPEKIFTYQRTGQIAESFAETASTVLGLPVLISDTDRFIAASGLRKKDYLNQQIDTALDEIIQCKEKSRTASRLVVPILTNGDPIGSVTVLPTENHALTETEVKTAELGAKLLACQMEN